jgi:single-strand DNA-binding protein
MASLNKVQLIGNLGRAPEMRYMPNGTPTATISLASTERWKDKASGEAREATEWHRVVFFRGLAEIVGAYLNVGSLVYVEGKLKTRKYTDKDGVEKYATEVQAAELQMLGDRAGPGSKASEKAGLAHRDDAGTGDDEVPF